MSWALRTSKILGVPLPYCAMGSSNEAMSGDQFGRIAAHALSVRGLPTSANSERNRFNLIVVSALAVDKRMTIISSAAALHALNASA